MRPPWRILDRLVLRAAWPALVGAAALTGVGWLAGGPILGFTAGSFALAVGLAVVYGILGRDGEYAALLQAGIAPRRIGAAVVAGALVIALIEAMAACAFFKPAVRTEYAGYVFSALQLPLMASLTLPISVRSRTEEPWARMVMLLIGYTIVTSALRALGAVAGWAPGLEWFFLDAALLAGDAVLYRHIAAPRAKR